MRTFSLLRLLGLLSLLGLLAGCAGTPGPGAAYIRADISGTPDTPAPAPPATPAPPDTPPDTLDTLDPTDSTHADVFVYNFVMNTTCHLAHAELWTQMQNTTRLRLAAKEWSASHRIEQWQNTPFAHAHTTDPTDPEVWRYVQLYNIPPTALSSHVQYVTTVYMPTVLAVIISTEAKLRINKYVYVTREDRPTMHTVTIVSDIPLIGTCVLYSRITAGLRRAVLSRNTFTLPVIPFYLKMFETYIELVLHDSLWRNTAALARAWCGELG